MLAQEGASLKAVGTYACIFLLLQWYRNITSIQSSQSRRSLQFSADASMLPDSTAVLLLTIVRGRK
jgi:hypothetical protein